MAGMTGGGGGGFDYVQTSAPADPKDAERWLDTSSAPYVVKVYNAGTAGWDAVATASDLSAHESASNPHSDSASDTDLNNHTGASNPHSDSASKTNFDNHTADNSAHHSRYSDSEAANAAPVQSVNSQTGDVSVSTYSPTVHASGAVTTEDFNRHRIVYSADGNGSDFVELLDENTGYTDRLYNGDNSTKVTVQGNIDDTSSQFEFEVMEL
jgi:hypothetical protein